MEKQEYSLGVNKIFVEHFMPEERAYKNPLVFVHGSFGGSFMWKVIVKNLADRGFECVVLSLRGHGQSGQLDLSSVNMSDYVEDVALIIKELGLKNPVMVGYGMAGILVLMYNQDYGQTSAIISIDPSPSLQVTGSGDESEIFKIPLVYNIFDAGLPKELLTVMEKMPDVSKEIFMSIKDMFCNESGRARRERKRGISIAKNSIKVPLLFIGAELGDSVPFGISLEKSEKMANYYSSELYEVKGATHLGILIGTHSDEVAQKIEHWLLGL